MAREPKHEPDHQRASWRFLAASASFRYSSAASIVARAISLRIALRSRAASAASRSALAFAEREADLRLSSSNFVGFGGGSGNTRLSPFQTSNAYTCRNERGLRLFDSRISNACRIAALTVSATISAGNRMSRLSSSIWQRKLGIARSSAHSGGSTRISLQLARLGK